MQSFLVICAICLQLNSLLNPDPQVLQQKETACNQCLTDLNKPPGSENNVIRDTPSSREPQLDNYLNSDPAARSERILTPQKPEVRDRTEKVSKNSFEHEKEAIAILEDKKTSLASVIHNKIHDLTLIVHYKKSEISNPRLLFDYLKKEEAKMINVYLDMLDKAAKKILNDYSTHPNEDFVNEFSIKMWQFSSKIQRLLLSKYMETLKERVEQLITMPNDSSKTRRILEEGNELPTKFKDVLKVHQVLSPSEFLTSENGIYEAVMQLDGNFVVYDLLYRPRWHASTYSDGKKMQMRPDGNLVIYSDNGRVIWKTETKDHKNGNGFYVKLENNGMLVMYDKEGNIKKKITV